MMEPRIQYAKTSDGVSIAYYAIGEGEPVLVSPPLGPSHLALERRFEPLDTWYRHISAHRTLIRWDPRGLGMSDRKVEDISDEAHDRDIEAVLAGLGLERVDVAASGSWAPFALSYAAHHPKAVRNLVVINTLLRWIDQFPGRPGKAVLSLAEQDWGLFTETAAHSRFGWSRGRAHEFAQFIRESQLQEDFLRLLPWYETWDVSPNLPSIRAETLVIYDGAVEFWGKRWAKAAREIASSVPKASVLEVRVGREDWMVSRDTQRAIDEFLGIMPDAEIRQDERVPSGTAIILFADIADSTALTERLGDAAFREKARELDEALRRAITSNGGTAIDGKLLGDGVLATFGAAREAIACAQEIHRLAAGAGDGGLDPQPSTLDPLSLHVGIHAGDVIRQADNVYGGAVNIAARVANEAAAGETLVSATVRELARTSAGVSFEDRGERELKGVSEPVRVFAVVRDRGSVSPP